VAFQSYPQLPAISLHQARNFTLCSFDLGQQQVGQLEQPGAGGSEAIGTDLRSKSGPP
jgi:hypothetical protein